MMEYSAAKTQTPITGLSLTEPKLDKFKRLLMSLSGDYSCRNVSIQKTPLTGRCEQL